MSGTVAITTALFDGRNIYASNLRSIGLDVGHPPAGARNKVCSSDDAEICSVID